MFNYPPVQARPPLEVWGPRLFVLIGLVWASGMVLGFQMALGILTAGGFVLALSGVLWPWAGLLGVGMLCTLDGLTRVYLMSGGWLRWNTLNYLLLVILVAFSRVTLRLADTHSRILVALLLLMTLQLTFSSDVEDGIHTLLGVVSSFGILVCFLRSAKDPEVIQWLGWCNGVTGAVGGAIFYQQMQQIPAINHNTFSAYPLTAMFSICLAYARVPAGGQLWLGLLALVNLGWVFLSGSRGGMLMAFVCVIFLVSQTRRSSHKLALFLAAPVMGLAILTAFSDLQQYAGNRLLKLFDDERSMANRTSGRSNLVAAGVYVFQNHPLGVGTGAFGNEFAGVHLVDLSFSGRDVNAHSAWIKILAENGLPGIVLLGAFVASFGIVRNRRDEPKARVLGLLVAGVLATSFISREFQSKSIWLLTAGYISMMSPLYAPFRPPAAGFSAPRRRFP